MKEKKNLNKVRCPACGYTMPVFYANDAECEKVYIPCKGRHCNHVIELKIKNGKQIQIK